MILKVAFSLLRLIIIIWLRDFSPTAVTRLVKPNIQASSTQRSQGRTFMKKSVKSHGNSRGRSLLLLKMKRAVCQGLRTGPQTSLDLISSLYAEVTATSDHQQAVRQFIDGPRKS